MSGSPMLLAKALTVQRGQRRVVRGVDFDLGAGEIVGLIGPNGAGKSTLLSALAGLIPSESTCLEIDGQPLAQLGPRALAKCRSYLSQESDIHWPLLVEKLVALGRIPHGGGGTREDLAAVQKALVKTRVSDLAQRPLNELSGGEIARASIARLFAVEANILLLDEPVAGLDPRYQLEIMQLLTQETDLGRSAVVVLHDLNLAARFCKRLVLMCDGIVHSEGVPTDVLTAHALGEVYGVEAEVDFSVVPPNVVLRGLRDSVVL